MLFPQLFKAELVFKDILQAQECRGQFDFYYFSELPNNDGPFLATHHYQIFLMISVYFSEKQVSFHTHN